MVFYAAPRSQRRQRGWTTHSRTTITALADELLPLIFEHDIRVLDLLKFRPVHPVFQPTGNTVLRKRPKRVCILPTQSGVQPALKVCAHPVFS